MLTVSDVSLRFSDRKLFDDVNINFTEGNTYGLIGANGAGKSTFLKILAGDIEPTTGHISLGPDERLSVLRQNHFDYEDERVIDVVIMGNEKLYNIMTVSYTHLDVYKRQDKLLSRGLNSNWFTRSTIATSLKSPMKKKSMLSNWSI